MAKSSKKAKAQTDEKVAVFYHAQCVDGAASAYAAHMKYGNNAKYYPIGHKSDKTTEKFIREHSDDNTHVIFADYAPTKPVLEKIIDHTKHVSIFDHHATAIEDLAEYKHKKLTKVFDEFSSGGAITFRQLHGRDKKMPQSIELAQRIDLGQFGEDDNEKTHNYQIAAYIDALPNTRIKDIVPAFDTINNLTEDEVASKGEIAHRVNLQRTKEAIDKASFARVQIAENTRPIFIPTVNLKPHGAGRELEAELKKLASQDRHQLAFCWYEEEGTAHVSIRSAGKTDAGTVAQYFATVGKSGGGHKTAAGAHFDIEDFNKRFPRCSRDKMAEILREESILIQDPQAQTVHTPDNQRERG